MTVDEGNQAAAGRPRSEAARQAVLNAADDLLVEMGYAAMTMKNIAERAEVSRQTVYRWWSTKAEILFEACAEDAEEELTIKPSGESLTDVARYLRGLIAFLSTSAAGTAYRALIGEAQHSAEVADLLKSSDILEKSAVAVLAGLQDLSPRLRSDQQIAAQLVAPVFYWIISGKDPAALSARKLARAFLKDTL